MSNVPLSVACEKLGVSDSAIVVSKKYKPFYKKTGKGKKNASFDLSGYRHRQSIEMQLLEKAKLFVEYLVHEEGFTYTEIAKIGKVLDASIYTHQFGVDYAFKLVRSFAIHRPFSLKRFDEFYTWEHKAKKTIKVLG